MRDGENRITPPRTGWIRGYGKPHSLDFDVSMKDMPLYVPPSQQKQFVEYSLPPEHLGGVPLCPDLYAAWKSLKAAGSRLRSPFTLRWCILTTVYIVVGFVIGWFAK